ncbi:hypothetical protein C8R43DRAFT_1117924 [Mycena crocata]|nr:hypothetical protein C8R43DRAFT_1117924 [Mycena crocata]
MPADRPSRRRRESDPAPAGRNNNNTSNAGRRRTRPRHSAPSQSITLASACTLCDTGGPVFRCLTCDGPPVCSTCMLSIHRRLPVHDIEKWSDGRWEGTTLHAMGLVYQEGHGGGPCPNPAPTTEEHWMLYRSGIYELTTRACKCVAA